LASSTFQSLDDAFDEGQVEVEAHQEEQSHQEEHQVQECRVSSSTGGTTRMFPPSKSLLLGSIKGNSSPLFGRSLLTRNLALQQQQQRQQILQKQVSDDGSDAETIIADEAGNETHYRHHRNQPPTPVTRAASAPAVEGVVSEPISRSGEMSRASLTPRSSDDTESDRLGYSLDEEEELSEEHHEEVHVHEEHHQSSSGLAVSQTPPRGRSVSPAGREGRQWLTADHGQSANSRSMESLRTTGRTYQAASERDLRRVVASSVEARSLESLERHIRRAVSGEVLPASGSSEESAMSPAERRRGLFAGNIPGERRTTVPQHLSLPPPCSGFLSPGDRRLTILSPHSPEVMQFNSASSSCSSSSVYMSSLKTRRKQAVVLPRLVLPRSDSVFSV